MYIIRFSKDYTKFSCNNIFDDEMCKWQSYNLIHMCMNLTRFLKFTIFPLENGIDIVANAGEHAHVSGIIELHVINRLVEPTRERIELTH